ncbi:MAG: hypothetical protein AB7G47_10590 [Mycolicibacterium sp.]|uniref:hypothetical protein n=1 Tax=Mycolicibacterium sp. TaxID=2320850 RepID=UPI003D0A5BF1
MAISTRELYEFAIELRQLAYAMPAGHEDPLIRLSERMSWRSQQEGAEDEMRSTRHAGGHGM